MTGGLGGWGRGQAVCGRGAAKKVGYSSLSGGTLRWYPLYPSTHACALSPVGTTMHPQTQQQRPHAMLCSVSAETYIKKASSLLGASSNEELELQYKSCYARIMDAKRR